MVSDVVGKYNIETNASIRSRGYIFPKLKGINIFFDDWRTWNYSIVDREITDIKKLGFNFVRTGIQFYRFYDFSERIVNRSLDVKYYDLTVYFMNSVKNNGLYISVVPIEGGRLGEYEKEYWWPSPFLQNQLEGYIRVFSEWCKSMGWTNIIYISIWWEPSWYWSWYDGAYVVQNNLSSYPEADIDWRKWLNSHGTDAKPLSIESINEYIDQYIEWSRDRFNQITQLKVNAVKEAWEWVLVGGEIGWINGTSVDLPAYHPSLYLRMSAEPYIDVLCLHDYTMNVKVKIIPYLASTPRSKPRVLEEVGPPYSSVDATNTTEWWDIVKPKIDLVCEESRGFAIWVWRDYDGRKLGLKDADFNSRPILRLVTDWISHNF
jgi:hypothetical protein